MAIYLICYDISDDRLRDEVSPVLQEYGNRVQRSVFEVALRGEAERETCGRGSARYSARRPSCASIACASAAGPAPGTSTAKRLRCSRAPSSCERMNHALRRHGCQESAPCPAEWRVALVIMGLPEGSQGERQGCAAEPVISMGYRIKPRAGLRSSARFAEVMLAAAEMGRYASETKGFPEDPAREGSVVKAVGVQYLQALGDMPRQVPILSSERKCDNDEDTLSLSRLGAGLGLDLESLSFAPLLYALRAALPIFQALILSGLYALLPFALLAARYSLQGLLLISVALFTVKFWSYLWHLAKWIEDNLITALLERATAQKRKGTSPEN